MIFFLGFDGYYISIGLYTKLEREEEMMKNVINLQEYLQNKMDKVAPLSMHPAFRNQVQSNSDLKKFLNMFFEEFSQFKCNKHSDKSKEKFSRQTSVFHCVISDWSVYKEDMEIFMKIRKKIACQTLDPELEDAMLKCELSMKINNFFQNKMCQVLK